VISFALGLLLSIDPLVSQAWGARDLRRVRFNFQQAMMLAAVLSIPISLLLWDVTPLLEFFNQQPEVIRETSIYVRTVILGVVPFLLFAALRQGLQAMSVVRPALAAIVIANVINAIANYVLIFGHFGAPRLGVRGSALATSLSRWSMLLLLIWLAWRHLLPLRLLRRWQRPEGREFALLFRVGVPISIHNAVEFWMITGIALMMGALGAAELGGHQIALVLAALAYMFSLGISGAAAARVGQAIGAGDPVRVRVAAMVSLLLAVGVMSLSALLFTLAPELLSRMFTSDPAVLVVASTLLPIAAFFQIFDGVQVVATGALRGAADTRVPAAIAILGYWVLCLPLGYLFTYRWGLGFAGPWWGLAVGLGVTAVLLLWRLAWRLSRPITMIAPSS
jgi:MATE family multidrug resistance protein